MRSNFIVLINVVLVLLTCCACLLKLQKRKSTPIKKWTPELIMNSTKYKDGLIDPEYYIDNFEDKNIILNLIDDIKRTKNIDTSIIFISEISDAYYSKKKKDISKFVDDLSTLLVNRNKTLDADSLIIVFSITDKLLKIRTGSNVKSTITNQVAQNILSSVKSYLRDTDYSRAAIQILQQAYDRLNGKFSLFGNKGGNSKSSAASLLMLLSICFIPCLCASCFKENSNYFSENTTFERNAQAESKLERIKQITSRNQDKKEFLESSCVICLEDFPQKQNQQSEYKNEEILTNHENKINNSNHKEIIEHNDKLPTLQEINIHVEPTQKFSEENQGLLSSNRSNDIQFTNSPNRLEEDLAKLDCGHTFHQKCIADWMEKQNSCPVCRNIIDSDNNTISQKPIQEGLLDIQRNIHPELNSYNYNFSHTGFTWIPVVTNNIQSVDRDSNAYQPRSGWNFGNFEGGWNNAGGADISW